MSLIKIIANGVEIDVVKETLTIKKDNTSMIRDFSVNHNTVPFLVVENEKAKVALGTRDITSVNKAKTIPVQVLEAGVFYYGELQILSYLNGFRKCNLKYATELLTIMGKKIASFMPVVSVAGDSTPTPYSETSASLVAGYASWHDFVSDIIDKNFPDVDFQTPIMEFKNLYGEDIDEEDTWADFQNKINNFDEEGTLIENTYEIEENTVIVSNKNTICPQVFLLSPLYYMLQSIGFKCNGSFVESEFVKRLLLLSSSSQMTEVVIYPSNSINVVFDGAWDEVPFYFPNTSPRKEESFTITEYGRYIIQYRFVLPVQTGTSSIPVKTSFRVLTTAPGQLNYADVGFNADYNLLNEVFEGEMEVVANVGWTMKFFYYNQFELMPVDYDISFRMKGSEATFQMAHPTIELSRFVPDWTGGAYINALKNFFNLEIDIDDFTKTVTINLNENQISSADKHIISKSLAIKTYDHAPYNAFLLKHENDEDVALWITREGSVQFTSQESSFTDTLESKFKYVPNNGYTAELSEDLIEKDGIGLMIYDPANAPFISSEYDGQTLKIEGVGGIYEVYWKKWLQFRLNAGLCEISGPFTEVELRKMLSMRKVFVDNQEYAVSNTQFSETNQGNFLVEMKVESITF